MLSGSEASEASTWSRWATRCFVVAQHDMFGWLSKGKGCASRAPQEE